MLALLLYGVFCIGFAWLNARWIKQNKHIYHGLNGAAHLTIIIGCGVFLSPLLAFAMLFEARLVFDTALNLFRGYPLGYVPGKPKSIADKVEKVVFEPLFRLLWKRYRMSYAFIVGILPKLIYAILFTTLLIIYSHAT